MPVALSNRGRGIKRGAGGRKQTQDRRRNKTFIHCPSGRQGGFDADIGETRKPGALQPFPTVV